MGLSRGGSQLPRGGRILPPAPPPERNPVNAKIDTLPQKKRLAYTLFKKKSKIPQLVQCRLDRPSRSFPRSSVTKDFPVCLRSRPRDMTHPTHCDNRLESITLSKKSNNSSSVASAGPTLGPWKGRTTALLLTL